ncbi:hypothetical protein ABBQ38_008961 [Trebouxia sp. C0009 RCD-2024]
MMQAAEHLPYETLLAAAGRQRRSSSSVPPFQSTKGRPSWSIAESQPSPSAWHETLNSRSLQNSPHRPAPPHARASHPEEEDWPDLTQLRWEGGATGVVRGQQTAPLHGEVRPNPTKTLQNLHGQVFAKSTNGRQQKMNGALADHRLPLSVSLAGRPRWGSPSPMPSGPQGRAVARSLSALPPGPQGRAVSRSPSRAAGQQLQSSYDTSGQMTQPLRTHISLDSLMINPGPAADQQDQFPAQSLIQVEPDHRPFIQHDGSRASAWHGDDRVRHQRSLVMQNGHANDRGPDRRGSEGVPCQPPPTQQPALHARGQDPAKKNGEEEAGAGFGAARAVPNFASPTRSSEAKAQQRSLHAVPFKTSRSRQSAGSITDTDALPLRKASEGSHQAAGWGGASAEGGQTPGSAAPLTSTFR